VNKNLRIVLIILGAALLIYVLYNLSNVLIYFFVSTILALVGRPLMVLLSKFKIKEKHLPNWLSALAVLVLFITLLVGFVRLFMPIINEEIQVIASIDVEELLYKNQDLVYKIEAIGEQLHIEEANIDSIKAKIADYLDFAFVSDLATTVISSLGSIMIGLFSVLFITFFFLKDVGIIASIIDGLTPDRYLINVNKILMETRQLLSRYFIGILLQITVITTIIWAGLSLVGIQNALLIAVLAGLLNIIPYVGPIIAGCIGILLGVTANLDLNIQTEMLPLVLKIATVFAVAQLTDNFLLQPIIFSKTVKAHPLEIFFVILIAGTLTGILGMILAVPFYTFLRIVAKEFFQGYKIVQGLTKDL
jgi:predicted PurR-regulated permease PerM